MLTIVFSLALFDKISDFITSECPEDGTWLPKGGQMENGHVRVSSSAQGERERKKEEYPENISLKHIANGGIIISQIPARNLVSFTVSLFAAVNSDGS